MAVAVRTRLTDDERTMVNKMVGRLANRSRDDKLHDSYYEGSQRLKHIGLAVPEELRIFELVVNWPGVYVDEVARRQNVKSLYRPGAEKADMTPVREAFTANNLAAEVPILAMETMVFGRCFAVVGANADDKDHPLITFESPTQMACLVNRQRRRMDAALRKYQDEDGTHVATLFLPDKTIQLSMTSNGWDIDEVGGSEDIDTHNLGRVPAVMFLNKRRLARWTGTTEMRDIIPITDACARTLTDMQYGVETVAVPKRYVLGMSKGDFVDKDGNALPAWQSYYQALWATQKGPKEAEVGQLPGADLSAFHNTIKVYAELASSVTGLPFRYFGANTANPAAEGAIRADESRVISNAEQKNTVIGIGLSWVLGIYDRIRTGNWPTAGEQVAIEWRDPATPTKAEEADAISKLNGGTPVLSREGSWDEMGWDDARKDRERKYFAEQEDPEINRIANEQARIQQQLLADTSQGNGPAADGLPVGVLPAQ